MPRTERFLVSYLLFNMVCLWGCSSGMDQASQIEIELVTDYHAGVDFFAVRTLVERGVRDEVIAHQLRAEANYYTGESVAMFDVPIGQTPVRVELIAESGLVLASRRSIVRPEARAYRIAVYSACEDVRCPDGGDPSATECVDGRCVQPGCSFDSPDLCPAGCMADGDCDPPVDCARATCNAEHGCLATPRQGACAWSQVCDPAYGCRDGLVPDASMDASVLDAGPAFDSGPTMTDAGANVDATVLDARATDTVSGASCGSSCSAAACHDGVIDCSSGTPQCVQTRQGDGTPCGAGRVIVSTSECTGTSTCDESGMQTDSVEASTCQAGSCTTASSNEDRACAVVTAGVVCGNTTERYVGTCSGFINGCSERSTRRKEVTMRTCRTGNCDSIVSFVDEVCETRPSRDGQRCIDHVSCRTATCTSGVCRGSGLGCISGQTCCHETGICANSADQCFP